MKYVVCPVDYDRFIYLMGQKDNRFKEDVRDIHFVAFR